MSTPAAARTKRKRRHGASPARPARPYATLGHVVGHWIEANLVHGEGDYYGQQFLLDDFQWPILDQCYALDREGGRLYDEVLVGLPKGNGKTPLAAAIACAEFAGPVVFDGWIRRGVPAGRPRGSPDIPVAAVSYEQADRVFGTAREMVKGGNLASLCEVYETEVLFKAQPGRMYKVPAVAGANDGGIHSFFVADELHEWVGNRERVHLILSNNRAKRRGAWQLAITTAGWDQSSLLGRQYVLGREGTNPRFKMIWQEAAPGWDLEIPAQLKKAVMQANPAARSFLNVDSVLRRFKEIAEHEFRRYFLNQWTAAPTQWMPAELWAAAAGAPPLAPGTELVLGFDGSYNRDCTALVGATLGTPCYLYLLGLWEKPAQAGRDWAVPRAEVLKSIDDALATYRVVQLGVDDTFGRIWSMDLEELTSKGVQVVEWPTRSASRIAPAAAALYGAVKDGRVQHDGSDRLAAHVGYSILKQSRWGPVPTKDAPESPRRIDAAIAAIVAYDVSVRQGSEGSWRVL